MRRGVSQCIDLTQHYPDAKLYQERRKEIMAQDKRFQRKNTSKCINSKFFYNNNNKNYYYYYYYYFYYQNIITLTTTTTTSPTFSLLSPSTVREQAGKAGCVEAIRQVGQREPVMVSSARSQRLDTLLSQV